MSHFQLYRYSKFRHLWEIFLLATSFILIEWFLSSEPSHIKKLYNVPQILQYQDDYISSYFTAANYETLYLDYLLTRTLKCKGLKSKRTVIVLQTLRKARSADCSKKNAISWLPWVFPHRLEEPTSWRKPIWGCACTLKASIEEFSCAPVVF